MSSRLPCTRVARPEVFLPKNLGFAPVAANYVRGCAAPNLFCLGVTFLGGIPGISPGGLVCQKIEKSDFFLKLQCTVGIDLNFESLIPPPKLSDEVDQKLGFAPIPSCKARAEGCFAAQSRLFSQGVPGIHLVALNDPSRPRGAPSGCATLPCTIFFAMPA
jgi:hypothetical protein